MACPRQPAGQITSGPTILCSTRRTLGSEKKFLTLQGGFTRESLALEVGTSFTSKDVQHVLAQVFLNRQPPVFIRSDNGPEFIARDLAAWLLAQGVQTKHVEPGRPVAERLRRELSRTLPGRMPQHGTLPLATSSSDRCEGMAAFLQSQTSAFQPRLFDPRRIRPLSQAG